MKHFWKYVAPVLLASTALPLFWLLKEQQYDINHFQKEDQTYSQLQPHLREYFIDVRGIKLHINEVGNPKGKKLLVFLHGFPETGLVLWKHQLLHFAESKDLRVIAPDMRGYNTSFKSDSVDVSNSIESALDICALIETLGYQKAYVVGHDWGGAVSFGVALNRPELVEKLIVINAPHPQGFKKSLSVDQLFKSWYMLFFQLNGISEWKLQQSDYAWLIGWGLATGNPKSYSLEDLRRLREAWSQPGALTSMINYYRQTIRSFTTSGGDLSSNYKSYQLQSPTLIIWGKKDPYLASVIAENSFEFAPKESSKLVYIEDATHWVPHEAPDQINSLIFQFIQ
mmetsp:Transcript_1217/g.1647  ORF Transcript_1217/g.1647 Transcript_1217/m.1647 type:complete len:340 (+) Transcript_1217:146-1165(+)